MSNYLYFFLSFFYTKHDKKNDRAHYIFYKIIDSVIADGEEVYRLQCINTKGIFEANILDIILDVEILHSLHPVQACYIGMESSKFLKNINISSILDKKKNNHLNIYSVCRYGSYELKFQDRKGNVNFIHKRTKEYFLMDPYLVALSKEFIEEFDAAQAFYIGLFAGFQLAKRMKQNNDITSKQSSLRVIK